MKLLIEALIGKHNISNSSIVHNIRCVYISDPNPMERVWIFIPLKEFLRRYQSNQIQNPLIEEIIKSKNIIGVWICPISNESSNSFYVRSATGNIEEDFDSLIKLRYHAPIVKEFTPRHELDKDTTLSEYYKKEKYFENERKSLRIE